MPLHWRKDTLNPNPYVPEPVIDPKEYEELQEKYEALETEYEELEKEYEKAVSGGGAIGALLDGTLEDLVVPDSVTELKEYAIYRNPTLKSVTIPETVTKKGTTSISLNPSLVWVDDKSPAQLTSSSYNQNSSLMAIKSSAQGAVGNGAISYNAVLPFFEFAEGITQLSGSQLFTNCAALEAVVLPTTVKSISSTAFSSTGNAANLVIYADFDENAVVGKWNETSKVSRVVYNYSQLPDDNEDIIKLNQLRAQRDAIIAGDTATIAAVQAQSLQRVEQAVLMGELEIEAGSALETQLMTAGLATSPAVETIQPVIKPGTGAELTVEDDSEVTA